MRDIVIDEHLTLRPIQETHATELFKVIDLHREHLREWLPWLDDNTETSHIQGFARHAHTKNAGGQALVQVIFYQGSVVGVCGYNFIDQANRWGEIGYWLAPTHQGKGIITRCVEAQIAFGIEHLHVHRTSISAAVENTRSRAVPERLGFQLEGVLRQSEWLYDHFVDQAVYARLATDPPA